MKWIKEIKICRVHPLPAFIKIKGNYYCPLCLSSLIKFGVLSRTFKREKEICICAGVKGEGGVIIRGHRHGDCIRGLEARRIPILRKEEAQGFITSRNRYVTREEGRKLQDKAGIKSVFERGYMKGTLFSEDLY